MSDVYRFKVIIVGSGGNGMSVAVKLLEAGIEDFTILTRHKDFGGAWYQNTYPGCTSNDTFWNYQFSYALSTEFENLWPTQPEILAYVQKVAADRDLHKFAHFDTEVLGAEWLNDQFCWAVSTNHGTYRADVLVLATGFLDKPKLPDIPGMDSFEGRIFHVAEWPAGYTGKDERVAVVGSASSGLQIVPALQKVATAVTAFQRTPYWVVPLGQRKLTEEDLAPFRESHEYFVRKRDESMQEWAYMLEHGILVSDPSADPVFVETFVEPAHALLEQVADPELRRALTPDYTIGAKDVALSDEWYLSLQKDNVELVPEAAAEIGAKSIKSASGREFEVDTIILATGYEYGTYFLEHIRRRDGRTVAEVQQGHPRAYKSISISGCPNLFLIGGPAPNGLVWNGLAPGEIGGDYIVKALRYMKENGILVMEADEEAEDEWKKKVDARLDTTIQVAGGCVNYIIDEHGHDKASWPGPEAHMAEALNEIDTWAYKVIAREDDVVRQVEESERAV